MSAILLIVFEIPGTHTYIITQRYLLLYSLINDSKDGNIYLLYFSYYSNIFFLHNRIRAKPGRIASELIKTFNIKQSNLRKSWPNFLYLVEIR